MRQFAFRQGGFIRESLPSEVVLEHAIKSKPIAKKDED
jgi:hypothetical protein